MYNFEGYNCFEALFWLLIFDLVAWSSGATFPSLDRRLSYYVQRGDFLYITKDMVLTFLINPVHCPFFLNFQSWIENNQIRYILFESPLINGFVGFYHGHGFKTNPSWEYQICLRVCYDKWFHGISGDMTKIQNLVIAHFHLHCLSTEVGWWSGTRWVFWWFIPSWCSQSDEATIWFVVNAGHKNTGYKTRKNYFFHCIPWSRD